jgi:hypothetical protein
MTKIAAIIGGVLLMAGVVLAGTVSSLGATGNPTIGSTLPTAAVTTTVRHEDRGREAEARGREREVRGRANEAREDMRREGRRADRHARIADDRGHHERGHEDGDHRGHGGHGGDD